MKARTDALILDALTRIEELLLGGGAGGREDPGPVAGVGKHAGPVANTPSLVGPDLDASLRVFTNSLGLPMSQAEAVAILADAQEIRQAREAQERAASWDRILWNRRPKNVSDVGDIDEIVAHNVTVHIEQMDDRCWWIGITWPDGSSWDGNFHATKKGEMTFGQQCHRDGGWPSDEEHEQ
jgi:hypothetical protein